MPEVKFSIAKDFISKIESNIKGLTDIIDSAEIDRRIVNDKIIKTIKT